MSLGVLYLTRTYVEVWKETLIIKPLIGSGGKRYGYRSEKDFSVVNDEVYLINNDTLQKLPVSKWLVGKRSLTSFLDWIKASRKDEVESK